MGGWRDGLGVSHSASVILGSSGKAPRQFSENIISELGMNTGVAQSLRNCLLITGTKVGDFCCLMSLIIPIIKA